MNREKTKNLTYCGLFTALIAIGAFIKIPIPVVPFTLQFLFTTLAGLLLGSKCGLICTATYVILGLIGLPIFSEGGGVWYVLKPSFGYLLGFCIGSYVTGLIAEKMKKKNAFCYLIAGFSGLLIVYLAGMAYYYVICNYVIDTPIAFGPLLLYCFVLAVPGDIFLCILSAFVAKRVKPLLYRQQIQTKEKEV